MDLTRERAKSAVLQNLYIEDVIDEFCDDYIVPCVQAHAVYENKYLLRYFYGSSSYRKETWSRLHVKRALSAICHGATGKGNDQVRFELGIKALAPDLQYYRCLERSKLDNGFQRV